MLFTFFAIQWPVNPYDFSRVRLASFCLLSICVIFRDDNFAIQYWKFSEIHMIEDCNENYKLIMYMLLIELSAKNNIPLSF